MYRNREVSEMAIGRVPGVNPPSTSLARIEASEENINCSWNPKEVTSRVILVLGID